MAKCNIPYIENTNYSDAVKEQLSAEHQDIFEKLKKSGQFRYSTNSKGKRFMYIADPSKVMNTRNVQLKVIADINQTYQNIAGKNVVNVGKIASGKNVVEVDVTPLANYYDRITNPVKQAVYGKVFQRSNNQFETNGEIFNSYEEAEVEANRGNEEYEAFAKINPEKASRILNPEQSALIHLLDKLKERTGIPYVTTFEPTSIEEGRFDILNGVPTVKINLAKATSGTVNHEFLHPFVMVVKQQNPNLYYRLVKEVITNHSDLIKRMEDLGYHPDFSVDEAMVRMLEDYSENPIKPSVIEEFFLWLQDFISWVTGIPTVGSNDLQLKRLAREFMYSDDLYTRLESIRQLTNLDAMFKITDADFQSLVKTKEFVDISKSMLGRVKTFRQLIKDKPNLFSSYYKTNLGELERVLQEYTDKGIGKNDEATMLANMLEYLNIASKNTNKIRRRFLEENGIYDQIKNAIAKGEDLNPYIQELEATRNYFHLYGDLQRIDNLINATSRADTEDFMNKNEILTYLNEVKNKINEQTYNDSLTDTQKANAERISLIIDDIQTKPLTAKIASGLKQNLFYLKGGKALRDGLTPLIAKENRATKKAETAIQEVFDNINDVKREFQKNYLDVLTETLWKHVPKNAIVVRGNQEIPMTKELLRTQLMIADGDTGTLDTWLSATISSRDAVSAIVARLLKDVIYKNSNSVISDRYTLQDLYSKVNPNKENAETFHQKYISDMKIFLTESGELQEADPNDVDVYVSPLDGKRYKTETRKRYKTEKRNDLIALDRKLLSVALNDVYVANPLFFDQQISAIGSNTRMSATEENNLREMGLEEMIDVINTFRSKDYTDVSYAQIANDQYYQAVFKLYTDSNESLAPDKRLEHEELPQLPNDETFRGKISRKYRQFMDEVVDGKDGTWFGRFVEWLLKSMEADEVVGANGGNTRRRNYLDDQPVYDLTVKFTKRLKPQDISNDLLSSTLAFSHSTTTYKSFSGLEPTINALKTVLVGDPEMDILARRAPESESDPKAFNERFNQYINKRFNVNSTGRLVEFVNDVLFDETELNDYQFKLGNKKYSISKAANNLLGFSSFQNIAFNWIAGMSNATTGNFNNISLAVGGKYFSVTDYYEAKKMFWKNIKNSLGDFGENDINKKSLIGQLVINLDAIQGDFFSLDGKQLNISTAQKLFTTNTLFFNQNATEYEIQVTGMLAIMKATKIGGKSMLDLVSVGPNGLQWDRSTGLTNGDIESLKHKIHALSKQLHGNYNKFDKSALQRRWYGRLALMFRKYLYTSFRARFGSKKYDYELEDVTKGYYREGYSSLAEMYKDSKVGFMFFFKLGLDYRDWLALASSYRNLTLDQQSAMKRTAFETALFLSALMVGNLIADIEFDDDDEFLKAIQNNAQLQALRLSKDFMMYTPVLNFSEFTQMVKTPTVALPVIEKLGRLAVQLLPNKIDETFDKKTGFAEKGDNKAFAYLLKVTPILRQFLNVMSADEQVKFYNMFTKNAE